ncbi:MAG: FHA domain-containing protein [Longimonas sp.]|uniref:FHA domain-containing protein n=1 Tax=Longimonas sp. TaxID=2039626 RepID=UPI003974792E
MAFRLTLTVRDEPPTRMLFEQDKVTVGRSPTNDVVVADPKVSKAHAVIELSPTGHHVVRDRESKNATFVDADRVEPEASVLLTPGATVHIGDSAVSYMPLVPATETPSASEEAPDRDAAELPDDPTALLDVFAQCLSRIAATWSHNGERSDEGEADRVGQYIDTLDERERHVLAEIAQHGTEMAQPETEDAPDTQVSDEDSDDAWGTLPLALRDLLELPIEVWGHLEEPPAASGNPFFDHPTVADIEAALRTRGVSSSDPNPFRDLCTALRYVVVHHEAVLRGYRASIETGGQALLRHISPRDSSPGAGKTGVFTRVFGRGDSGVNWERLERQWRKLYHSNWAAVEEKLFRPSLLATYREHMQELPDVTEPSLPKMDDTPLEEVSPA